MKVLCFGSANLDHVYKVDHFTAPGETQSCLDYAIKCGGKGVNQAIAMALAGNETYFAGMIGHDGSLLKETLDEKKVHIDYLKISDKPTGHAIIEVDQSGQNHILLYGGTNKAISYEYIDEVLSRFSKDDIIVLQNEINNVPYIIERSYEKGMKIFFNAAPYDDEILNYPIDKVTWLIVNETEGAALSGEENEETILKALKQKYPCTHILFTMGKEGSRVLTDKDDIKVKAMSVEAVDTTGAGDTYIGYFVRGIVENMPLLDTLQLATKASAIAVTRFGATDSIPHYEEVSR
ncbi:ribokinase [Coprobacillus sp. AF33-1AC]|uniref:ribokinase n=1 Tax=Coprobacillus sp. AF33-1AC TaxID=2292032 RepID=UPI000E50FCD5|nr:ribokinase [Coprobacillus sp. AF33-1AC]RHM58550.1 ribokinase [Coprobacillus sp. AF33-1AC]